MGLFNDTEADVKAINDYFNRTAPKTAAAAELKKQWVNWYSGLNSITMMLDSTFQEASNRRNAFDVAQAKNEQELKKTKDFIASSTQNDKSIRPDLYKKTDSAGNFTKVKGVTVASAAPGTIQKGSRPTIRYGSQGDAVKAWQKIVGVTADGIYGTGTVSATKAWQRDHGLTADGVVGSATWAAALGGDNAPDLPFSVAAVTPVSPEGTPASKAATGTVALIKDLSTPKPTKIPVNNTPPASKTVADAAAKPAEQTTAIEPVKAGLSLDTFKQLPTWGKVALGTGLAGLTGWAVWTNKHVMKR